MGDDAFAPLSPGSGGGDKPTKKSKPKITPIIPAPGEAFNKISSYKHHRYGEPSVGWQYHNEQGQLVGFVARFNFINEAGQPDKVVLPVCWCRVEWSNGRTYYEWRASGVPEPRPLFNLPELLANPNASVIFCEGEKTTSKVSEKFSGFVGTTTMGGSEAPHKSDFGPLAGRNITVWHDNDKAGVEYRERVAQLATRAGAAMVKVVTLPPGLPPGWDIADELPLGVTGEQIGDALRAAAPWQPPEELPPVSVVEPGPPGLSYVSFGLYRMSQRDGLTHDVGDKMEQLSDPFEILASSRDADNTAWGKLLRWRDPEGLVHEYTVLMRALVSRTDELWAELLDGGLKISLYTSARNKLANYLLDAVPSAQVRSVARIGWHFINDINEVTPVTPEVTPGATEIPLVDQRGNTGNTGNTAKTSLTEGKEAFVLGGRAYSGVSGRDHVVLQTEKLVDLDYETSGELTDWQTHIAQHCMGNSRLVFSISVAFAAPLLKIIDEEGGGFHLVAESRKGKTTLLRAASSVCGGNRHKPTGYLSSWRTTTNRLEDTASAHCDMLLALDEMGELEAKDAGASAYMPANGVGKGRMTRTGGARPTAQWRLLFLSSGELTLSDKMAEIGRRTKGGQEVRMIDLPADAGAGFGVFEDLHGFEDAGAFAEYLRQATQKYYGTAIDAYLTKLVLLRNANASALRQRLLEARAEFMRKYLPVGASPQVRSVCSRFAIVAAGGLCATGFGITGWPEDEAECNVAICFRAWLEKRGTAGDHDIESGIRQIRAYIEAHGSSRFEAAWENSKSVQSIENRIEGAQTVRYVTERVEGGRSNRVGFRKKDDDTGNWQYFVLPEQWKLEVAKGCPESLATEMVKRGLLIPDNARRSSKLVKVPNMGTMRLYSLSLDFLVTQ